MPAAGPPPPDRGAWSTSAPPAAMNVNSASERRGWCLGSCTTRFHATAATSPTSPMTAKFHCQPQVTTIHPISGANSTVEKYWAELKIAAAVPRSCVGNHCDTTRALPGSAGASAMPTRKRSANSIVTATAPLTKATSPCAAVNSDQTMIAKR